MSILIRKETTVIIQGITGREAVNLTREGLDYGTRIVGGVTPGRAGRDVYGVPVYDCVRDITSQMTVDGSIVTVPPRFTRDAVFEAIEAGVKLIVIVTERIPRAEVAQMVELAGLRGARIIGPNCLGILSPEDQRLAIETAQAASFVPNVTDVIPSVLEPARRVEVERDVFETL